MDPNVNDMKYNELRQYAKDLGITHFNAAKPKKEEILDAVKLHFDRLEQEQQESSNSKPAAKKRVKKSKEDPPLVQAVSCEPKTPSKTTKKQLAVVNDEPAPSTSQAANTEEEAAKPKRAKKAKRPIVETAKVDGDGDGLVEVEAVSPAKKRKTKSKKEAKVEQQPKATTTESEIVHVATKTKKSKKQTDQTGARTPGRKVAAKKEETDQVDSKQTGTRTPGRKAAAAKKETENQVDSKPKRAKTPRKTAAKKETSEKEEKTPKKAKKNKKSVKKKVKKASSSPVEEENNQEQIKEQEQAQDELVLRLDEDDEVTNQPRMDNDAMMPSTTRFRLAATERFNQSQRGGDGNVSVRNEELVANNTSNVSKTYRPNDSIKNASLITEDEASMNQSQKTPVRSKSVSSSPRRSSASNKSSRKSLTKASTVLSEIMHQGETAAATSYENTTPPISKLNKSTTRRSSQRRSVVEQLENEIVDKTESNDVNITNDIQNTTFDKSLSHDDKPAEAAGSNVTQALTCTSFYKSNAQDSNQMPTHATDQTVAADDVVVVVVEKEKPKLTGARIIRPTEKKLFLVETTNKKDETITVEVVKKVEIVRQEAGPRIVKPATISLSGEEAAHGSNEKKKKSKVSDTKTKPVPNFKAIHEKNESKMENLQEFMNRQKERARKITGQKTSLTSPAVPDRTKEIATGLSNAASNINSNQSKPQTSSKLKTPTLASRLINHIKPKTPTSKNTPKMMKSVSASTMPNSNIPRFNKLDKDQKTDKAQIQPKTPNQPKTPVAKYQDNNNNKTPSSTRKIIQHSSAFLGSIKKTLKIGATGLPASSSSSSAVNSDNGFPSSTVSTSNLLLSSSFNRRKSYDLSLRNQLAQFNASNKQSYNPHIGKIKPFELNQQSVFANSETSSATKPVDLHNPIEASKARINAIKSTKMSVGNIRKSIFGSLENTNTGYHPDLKKHTKTQLSINRDLEATALNKKMQQENAKAKKEIATNINRNIGVANENLI